MDIDTADIVRHEPTGEEWLVAHVRGERIAWSGWPAGEAAVSDCTLIRKATHEERAQFLQELSQVQNDVRGVVARERLKGDADVR